MSAISGAIGLVRATSATTARPERGILTLVCRWKGPLSGGTHNAAGAGPSMAQRLRCEGPLIQCVHSWLKGDSANVGAIAAY